jgi:DNA-binding CsgD family transcriptional regulator
VRTVESHVLQARAKLGAARRSELGMYLLDLVGQG